MDRDFAAPVHPTTGDADIDDLQLKLETVSISTQGSYAASTQRRARRRAAKEAHRVETITTTEVHTRHIGCQTDEGRCEMVELQQRIKKLEAKVTTWQLKHAATYGKLQELRRRMGWQSDDSSVDDDDDDEAHASDDADIEEEEESEVERPEGGSERVEVPDEHTAHCEDASRDLVIPVPNAETVPWMVRMVALGKITPEQLRQMTGIPSEERLREQVHAKTSQA